MPIEVLVTSKGEIRISGKGYLGINPKTKRWEFQEKSFNGVSQLAEPDQLLSFLNKERGRDCKKKKK